MNKYLVVGVLFIIIIFGWLAWPVNAVPILAYHQVGDIDDLYSIPASQFEEQLAYLASNGYHTISLEDLFNFYDGQGKLPDKPVIITFDDGYEDNYLTALPILEKYNMSATVFIVPNLIATPDYLSWQQVTKMQRRHIEIGSHTMSHIAMDEISEEQQWREASESKRILEQHVGKTIRFFAYPFGQFTTTTERILQAAGYRGACAGMPGLNDKTTDAYAMKRINMPHPKYGLWEFRLRLFRANLYNKLGL